MLFTLQRRKEDIIDYGFLLFFCRRLFLFEDGSATYFRGVVNENQNEAKQKCNPMMKETTEKGWWGFGGVVVVVVVVVVVGWWGFGGTNCNSRKRVCFC